MAKCNGCKKEVSEGKLCSLCIAKMISYHDGDYNDENDPAVRLYHETAAKMNSPKPSSDGCALVLFAIMSLSAILAAAGIGIGNFIS
ncbi:hypothetical protein AB0B56_42795 [Streptosporangium canum]|uniref:Uncharacterized protein n=1 Tax=Streptosporangium canum TaxID=324952 RepID=A0A1I4E6B6_9ACTN|nr:hypothetical protein [Streptosporangium canum]SFK99896.1 hypothetical protein SAMN05216275_14619 [Streptosporangium canum]